MAFDMACPSVLGAGCILFKDPTRIVAQRGNHTRVQLRRGACIREGFTASIAEPAFLPAGLRAGCLFLFVMRQHMSRRGNHNRRGDFCRALRVGILLMAGVAFPVRLIAGLGARRILCGNRRKRASLAHLRMRMCAHGNLRSLVALLAAVEALLMLHARRRLRRFSVRHPEPLVSECRNHRLSVVRCIACCVGKRIAAALAPPVLAAAVLGAGRSGILYLDNIMPQRLDYHIRRLTEIDPFVKFLAIEGQFADITFARSIHSGLGAGRGFSRGNLRRREEMRVSGDGSRRAPLTAACALQVIFRRAVTTQVIRFSLIIVSQRRNHRNLVQLLAALGVGKHGVAFGALPVLLISVLLALRLDCGNMRQGVLMRPELRGILLKTVLIAVVAVFRRGPARLALHEIERTGFIHHIAVHVIVAVECRVAELRRVAEEIDAPQRVAVSVGHKRSVADLRHACGDHNRRNAAPSEGQSADLLQPLRKGDALEGRKGVERIVTDGDDPRAVDVLGDVRSGNRLVRVDHGAGRGVEIDVAVFHLIGNNRVAVGLGNDGILIAGRAAAVTFLVLAARFRRRRFLVDGPIPLVSRRSAYPRRADLLRAARVGEQLAAVLAAPILLIAVLGAGRSLARYLFNCMRRRIALLAPRIGGIGLRRSVYRCIISVPRRGPAFLALNVIEGGSILRIKRILIEGRSISVEIDLLRIRERPIADLCHALGNFDGFDLRIRIIKGMVTDRLQPGRQIDLGQFFVVRKSTGSDYFGVRNHVDSGPLRRTQDERQPLRLSLHLVEDATTPP